LRFDHIGRAAELLFERQLPVDRHDLVEISAGRDVLPVDIIDEAARREVAERRAPRERDAPREIRADEAGVLIDELERDEAPGRREIVAPRVSK
jgi:hypothetical protein